VSDTTIPIKPMYPPSTWMQAIVVNGVEWEVTGNEWARSVEARPAPKPQPDNGGTYAPRS